MQIAMITQFGQMVFHERFSMAVQLAPCFNDNSNDDSDQRDGNHDPTDGCNDLVTPTGVAPRIATRTASDFECSLAFC